MATISDAIQSSVPGTNGAADVERLKMQVQALQEECRTLRDTLAATESEREAYRQLFLQEARERREFEDFDIPTAERMSAGPVEKL